MTTATDDLTNEDNPRALCDLVLEGAAGVMQASGASVPMILDRMLTYAAAQAVAGAGSAATAEMFRQVAANIEGGALARIDALRARSRH